MRTYLATAALLAALGGSAHAMGTYVTYTLLAWNGDGTSGLVERTTTSSGTAGSTVEYVLVSAGSKTPVIAAFTDTRDPDKASEKIDRPTCQRTAAAFTKALADHHVKGVTVKADACAGKRDVVQVAADTTRAAAVTWVASPIKRPATPREAASWAAVKAVLGPRVGGDVASATGKLILVFSGENGDGSGPARLAAYVPAATGGGVDALIAEVR